MQLIYHPKVRDDLADAAGFLEEKRSGLGAELVAEAESAARMIAANPLLFAPLRDGTRRMRLSRFPYAVYFDLPSPEIVRILVVTHGARRPGHWHDRLAE